MTEIKTLVVDDDEQLLDIMERRLRKAGLDPDRADNGRAAIVLLERNRYDLIVTDIYMPGATGLALLRKAKEMDPHTQVVVVTAAATLDNAIEAMNEGAFGYLNKPFDHVSAFDNMVARAIEHRRLLLDNKRMAEAQRRRGDMLEEEVTERVQQLRKRQKQLIDILGALPDGVVVVEQDGHVVLTSPIAERWLAVELRGGGQPIQRFIENIHAAAIEDEKEVLVGEQALRLKAVELPAINDKSRWVVIIRELETKTPDFHTGLAQPLMNLKKGLAWLYRHRKIGEVTGLVEHLAQQVSELERLTGIRLEEGAILDDLEFEQALAGDQAAAEVGESVGKPEPELEGERIVDFDQILVDDTGALMGGDTAPDAVQPGLQKAETRQLPEEEILEEFAAAPQQTPGESVDRDKAFETLIAMLDDEPTEPSREQESVEDPSAAPSGKRKMLKAAKKLQKEGKPPQGKADWPPSPPSQDAEE